MTTNVTKYTIAAQLAHIIGLLEGKKAGSASHNFNLRGEVQPFIYKLLANKQYWSAPQVNEAVLKRFPTAKSTTAKDALKTLTKKGKIKRVATNVYRRTR